MLIVCLKQELLPSAFSIGKMYSKTYLQSLFWTATCLMWPLHEIVLYVTPKILCLFYSSFVRSPAFYGQFLLTKIMALQNRYYCTVETAIYHTCINDSLYFAALFAKMLAREYLIKRSVSYIRSFSSLTTLLVQNFEVSSMTGYTVFCKIVRIRYLIEIEK